MDKIIIQIQANIVWEIRQDVASRQYLAVCHPLKLTVQGETWSALVESISETLDAVFEDLMDTGELDRFLEDHGWRMQGQLPQRHKRNVRFNIPWGIEKPRAANDRETVPC